MAAAITRARAEAIVETIVAACRSGAGGAPDELRGCGWTCTPPAAQRRKGGA